MMHEDDLPVFGKRSLQSVNDRPMVKLDSDGTPQGTRIYIVHEGHMIEIEGVREIVWHAEMNSVSRVTVELDTHSARLEGELSNFVDISELSIYDLIGELNNRGYRVEVYEQE